MRFFIKKICLLGTVLLFAGCIDAPDNPKGYISVASFNIQIFGQSKISKPDVMATLVDIVREFDVIAVQEIRSKRQNVIPKLLDLVNTGTISYDYVISERLGRSSSKEQYAIIYNEDAVACHKTEHGAFEDEMDRFEREPHIVFCKSGNFDFLIVNNHIKPDDAEAEIGYLGTLINYIYDFFQEEDVIVLGDMNADGSYYDEDDLDDDLRNWVQLINNDVDTTVSVNNDNTYDRMMVRTTTSDVEFDGEADVFRWDLEYGISDHDFVKKVSDHYPVYAVFSTNLNDDD